MRVTLAARTAEVSSRAGKHAGDLTITVGRGAGSARVAALAALVLAILSAGCAGAPLADDPPGPPPFRSLRRIVLVRAVDRSGAQRPKDPLDAVRESLEADGRTTRTVELGPGLRRDLAGVARLYTEVEGRIEDGGTSQARGRPAERLGRSVAGLLDELQADGTVLFYRLARRPLLPPAIGSSPLSREPIAPRLARPAAALALVDRDGNLLWFDWGAQDLADRDPGAPATAAEAVDALLRVIRGDADAPDA
jgi:hypothetical protein